MSVTATRTGAPDGNLNAVRHGAQSVVLISAKLPAAVAELSALLGEAVPFAQPADALLIERAARQIVRLRRLDDYLDDLGGGLTDSRGRPRTCWRLYLSLERSLRETLGMLGVGPVARAQIAGPLAAAHRERRTAEAIASLRERYGRPSQPSAADEATS